MIYHNTISRLCIILCLLVSPFFLQAQSDEKIGNEVKALIDKSEQLHAKGEYEAAFEMFVKASSLGEGLPESNEHYLLLNIKLAEYLSSLGFNKEAISRTKLVLLLLNKHHSENLAEAVFTTAKLSGMYFNMGEYDSALFYSKRNIQLAKRVSWTSSASQYNNTGFFLYKIGQTDSAMIYFQVALQHLQHTIIPENKNLHYAILDNIGEIYFGRKQYAKAYAYFMRCDSIGNHMNNVRRHAQSHLQLAKTYIKTDRFNDARNELALATPLISQNKTEQRYKFQIQTNDIWKDLYKATGLHTDALRIEEQSSQLRDSLNKAETHIREGMLSFLVSKYLKKANAEIALEQEKRKHQEEELRLTQKTVKLNWIIIIVTIVFSISLIVWLITYLKATKNRAKTEAENAAIKIQLHEEKLKNIQLEEEKLRNELTHKRQDISDLSLYVSNLKNFHDTLRSELEGIKKLHPESQAKAIKSTISDINNRIDLNEKTTLIHQHIEDVNSEFYSRLRAKHPSLTNYDWELCGLIRLSMNNKEIAALKSIDPNSVKRSKTRLRKKLDLDIEADILAYLRNI